MRKLFLLFILSLTTIAGFAQNLERYNWYFGNSTQAIRFNRTSQKPSLTTKAIPFGGAGNATVSDPANANLLFYTDGQFVYDATLAQMPLGSGLTGNTISNQPVVVCPVPGQQKKYFIFTNTANFTAGGTISVSVVDLKLFGTATFPAPALGDLESKNQPVAGLITRSEGMMIVPHTNGIDFWLITQQVNSTNFSSTLINAGSYTGTFITTTTSGLSSIPLTAANFSYHAGKKKVAVSAQDTNTDAIILNFDATTGVFSFDRFILNSGKAAVTNQSIYDIEWSLKGDFLYLSRFGETGLNADLLQYDYLNSSTTLTSILPSPVFRSFGVQIAPDSSIYHLYQAAPAGPILLGKFSKTDTIASQVKYQTSQLTSTSFSGIQFPSFAPKTKVNLLVDFSFIGTCQNNNTTLFPVISPGADSLRWNLVDITSKDWSPVHKYTMAKTYSVKLTAFYQGDTASITKPVTITAFAIKLNLVQDTTACSCELKFPKKPTASCNRPFKVTVKATGGTPTSYVWSNGNTGPTLSPDSAGYYYVVVSDASGCSTYAGVNVKEYGVMDQRSNIWYFGQNAGINFNRSPPVPLTNSAMNAPEGCAIICDRNGQAIFYTDGFNVYNKKDVLISPALGIGGDQQASQSSIIVPVPGDETLYYIFTNEAINGSSSNTVKYSLFDLKLNSGTGAVVKNNQILFSKGTERITASGKWLIIHEYGNNTFRSYKISQSGIGEAVLTAIGSDHVSSNPATGMGYMKLGPKNLLAVALSTGSSNLIELFHLNDSTGRLTNYRKIDLNQPGGQVYGIEFSPGGNKIFATVKGNPTPSQLFEYSIDSLMHTAFVQKIDKPLELGALQIAPDGQIYIAINGSTVLGTIQATDNIKTINLSPVNWNGFTLAGGTSSKLGLPNFIQQISNAFGGPALDISGICLGTPTKFTGTATDAIDKFNWFFGDGGSDTQSSPQHTYATAGTYTVSMRLTNRCGLDVTLVKPTTIFAPPAKPTIPGASVLCNGPVLLDANTSNAPNLLYLWSDQSKNKTLTVSQQSIISVSITDKNGCSSNGSTIVVDNQPKVELGPDKTLCQNSFTTALNANNPGLNYVWTVNGGSTTTAQSRQLDTTVPGVFKYKVVITDPITNCTATDQATFTIIPSPVYVLGGIDPTICNAANGSLSLQLQTTAPLTGPYSYFVTGPALNQQGVDQAAPQTINFPGLKAGTYSTVISDQVSGCSIAQSFGLSDAPFSATATALAPNCDPVTIQITSNAVSFPLKYQITPVGTGTSVGPISGIVTPVFNTSPVTAGTYTIQITDNGGCIFIINNFVVTPNAPIAFTITPTICNTPPTITASGASSYTWTGPGIVGATNNPSIQVSGAGSQTYTAIGSTPGNCPSTQNITVFLDNPVVDFLQTDPCQTSVNLSATPSSGPYTYRWYKSGVLQPALLGQTISIGLSENGASYAAEAVNATNGCAYRSVSKNVQVLGTVNATLVATPACEDSKPFTLTSSTTATSVTYAWFKNNTVIPGLTTSSITQSDAGTYRVEISKSVTCKATAEITVFRAPLPVGKLPNRVIICNDPENTDPTTNQVDLDPGKFTAYNWFKNELTLNYALEVLTATSQGKYRVDITNSFGCIAPDETEVGNECIPKIEVPNAFRPSSGISENKDFYAFTFFIKDTGFQIFLYNRWGELVYTSSDRYFKWNGGYNGIASQPVPGGSYAYVIQYISAFHPERGTQEKRGGVAVLR